jgi:2-oxoglutarate dehydrogenase E2 component (dihydrolipoamide succinyltransferase)
MKQDIQVPEIGESVTSGILAAWLKSDGENVGEGEEVFELETDKATLAVPSPAGGVLSITVAEGEEVEVGQAVGTVDTEGTPTADAGEPAEGARGNEAQADSAGRKAPADGPAAGTPASSSAQTLSPAVRRVVEEHGLDPSAITGTGPGGRITKEDATKAAEKRGTSPSGGAGSSGGDRKSSPAAGSPAAHGERQRRVPMSNLRKRIAENLVQSRHSSAHVTTFSEVDMSAIMSVRARYKETFAEQFGVRLGFMSFFVKASQHALEKMPEINAYLDGTDVVYNDYVNIGVALSTDKGLLTPVIKDVATHTFADVERAIVDFGERANAKRLKPDEMVGATFTISNGGVFGSLLSTPIPSPPQTAVLGMHAIEKRPVVVNDEVVVRPMMYLALTYDHRMVDGREAVTFLGHIKALVEDPTRLLLGM